MKNNPIRGICMLMCPESEIAMRQREGLLHPLELRQGQAGQITTDRRKMVKMFGRSAAGKDLLRADELRPPPVLKKTVNYLLSTVVCETHMPWSTVYMFVSDRLRSVRQDMVVQQTPPVVCCTLLERVVRFYAYAGYRLCEEPLELFDPHLNHTQLNECLKHLLVCYDSLTPVDTEDYEFSPAREQMEALYGLLHLGNEDSLRRMLSLTPYFKEESLLSTVLNMSLSHFNNNYVSVCRQLRFLPPLLACVAVQHLAQVRRRALSVMNCAYSSKNLRYALHKLRSVLLFNDDKEAVSECQRYGLAVDSGGVHFLKGSFNLAVKESKTKRLHFIDESLDNVPLPELLLTASDTENQQKPCHNLK